VGREKGHSFARSITGFTAHLSEKRTVKVEVLIMAGSSGLRQGPQNIDFF
jgi:hypothetical protein